MSVDWGEETPSIELLKQMVTMRDVVEMLGFEVGNDNKIPSPWNPDERTPSCHVYEDHWWDFSHGKGGDIIDFVQAVDPSIPTKRAIGLLWRRGLKAGMEPGDVERQPVREVVDFWEEFERHTGWDKRDRDVWEPIVGCPLPGLGATYGPDELWIPHMDSDGMYGIKVREMGGAKRSLPGSQFTKRLYHPQGWRFVDTQPTAVITEGESDCWHVDHLLSSISAGQGRADVFALPSGSGSWKDDWLTDLEPYDKVVVVMDNDRAGKEAREKLARKIGFDRVKDVMVPQLFNDVREARQAGWDGLQLLQAV